MKKVRTRTQHREKPRRTPRQVRSQQTVDAILFAASHILRSHGADAITTDRVAHAAGVSIGSLYQYFADKQAIVAAVRTRHGDWLAAETRAGIERGANAPSLREGVRASIERMVELQRLDSPLRGTPRDSAPLTPAEFAAFRTGTEHFIRANAAELRPVDPALAAVVITRAAEALLRGLGRDEPHWLTHPAFVDEVTELVLGYLAPRDS
jgi:AcrR family transcriptional regulator